MAVDQVNPVEMSWSGAGPNRRPSAFQAGRADLADWPKAAYRYLGHQSHLSVPVTAGMLLTLEHQTSALNGGEAHQGTSPRDLPGTDEKH